VSTVDGSSNNSNPVGRKTSFASVLKAGKYTGIFTKQEMLANRKMGLSATGFSQKDIQHCAFRRNTPN